MKLNEMNHVSINVINMEKVKQFFIQIGLNERANWKMDGVLVDNVTGLHGVKTECVGLGIPGGQTWIELVKFHAPINENILESEVNTLGIRHLCFNVTGIDEIIMSLQQLGYYPIHDIQQYENLYRLCYIKGPEGIIVELAENI